MTTPNYKTVPLEELICADWQATAEKTRAARRFAIAEGFNGMQVEIPDTLRPEKSIRYRKVIENADLVIGVSRGAPDRVIKQRGSLAG